MDIDRQADTNSHMGNQQQIGWGLVGEGEGKGGLTWKWCGVTLVGREEGPRALVATLSNMRVMKLSWGSSSVPDVAPSACSSSPLIHTFKHTVRSISPCMFAKKQSCIVRLWNGKRQDLSTYAGAGKGEGKGEGEGGGG